MTEAEDTVGRESPMIRLCLNCDTDNAVDAVICSECGMSLARSPVGETAEKGRSVADIRDDADQQQEHKRYLRWGLGLAAMSCWTILVAGFALLFAGVSYLSAGGVIVMGDPELEQWYHDMATTSLEGGFALALAPWVALFLQRWWSSRTAPTEKRETARGVDLSDRDLTEKDLFKADLRRANLLRANLSRANLEGANLSHANLYGANLQGATLREATFDQADIRYANLRQTNLQAAILHRANLYQADLRGAELHGADLLQAKLAGATLDESTAMPEGWEDVVASKPQDWLHGIASWFRR